ncbi:MAG: carotenoid biosynthesis protein [Candidatus Hydrogenedentes bacterium]|nr:carotenoid biosynthesis protein [Candidatus Hydrogenedentota bacterium]
MRKRLLAALGAAYIFFWLGGVGAYWFLGEPPAHVAWTAPLFLSLAGVLVLLTAAREDRPRILACGAVGLLAEMVGVHTGFPFGSYIYTKALYPHVVGVPLVMVCAWFILVAYVQEMLREAALPAWARVGVGAVWLTSIDLIIDPLAAGPLKYWVWEYPGIYYGIPATNFAGWLLVSLAVCAIAGQTWRPNPHARPIGLSIILFFTSIALAKGMLLAAAIGALLCILHATLSRRMRRLHQ